MGGGGSKPAVELFTMHPVSVGKTICTVPVNLMSIKQCQSLYMPHCTCCSLVRFLPRLNVLHSTNLSPSASATYSLATIMVLSGRMPRMTSMRCNLSSLSSKSGTRPQRRKKVRFLYVARNSLGMAGFGGKGELSGFQRAEQAETCDAGDREYAGAREPRDHSTASTARPHE